MAGVSREASKEVAPGGVVYVAPKLAAYCKDLGFTQSLLPGIRDLIFVRSHPPCRCLRLASRRRSGPVGRLEAAVSGIAARLPAGGKAAGGGVAIGAAGELCTGTGAGGGT